MSGKSSFTSERYPYLPVTVVINKEIHTVEAMLDTGFEGDLILPEGFLTHDTPPDSYLHYTLADPTATVLAPSYLGKVEVAHLGDAGSSVAIVSVLGTEPILGRNLARRFHLTLERGRRVRIEPLQFIRLLLTHPCQQTCIRLHIQKFTRTHVQPLVATSLRRCSLRARLPPGIV